MSRTILHNATIVNEGQIFAPGYVVIDGDVIAAVGRGDAPGELLRQADRVEDMEGRYVMPGVIDTHVHFREPGMEEKGTIASESAAAIAGGVTSYLEMPNTRPATVTLPDWEWKMNRAASTSLANYGFFIGATADNLDSTLLQMDYTRCPGVKLFMGSSTGGMLLDDDDALRRIFTEVKAPIVVHAEDEATIAAARERVASQYPEGEIPIKAHSEIRPAEACLRATCRAITLAKETGARLHVAHVSTAAELKYFPPLLDPERRLITAETCPQYLLFYDRDYPRLDARIKCNPAIKKFADMLELRQAVVGESIDSIATDHAPHQLALKRGDALTATSGMPGVQFSLPLMLRLFGLDIVAKMTHAPARLFGIERRGYLRPGYYADIAVVEKLDTPRAISDDDVVSPCGWTPYVGIATPWRVVHTMVNGRWAMRDGIVDRSAPTAAMPLSFKSTLS